MSDFPNLSNLFNPQSVAVIGASERPESVGLKVMSNLMQGEFSGGLYPVNPKHTTILGKTCYPDVTSIPSKIDLAVITTPAETTPLVLKACGEKGIRAVIIISAGFSEMGEKGKALEQELLAIANDYNLHFLGPNCLGMMRPAAKLNATFDNNNALPGQIALLSQSGAICAAILDWALEREIGFSTIVSMGNSIDLDFGEILTFLANDPLTKSILLYIEGVHYPERFIKGLRAASKVKPVIAIKAGRHATGVRAVHSHTGALVGDDDVFAAALLQGGAVRVLSIEQLFTAAEVLASAYLAKGNRLTIVTNGGGAGVMAADRAADLAIPLATLSDNMLTSLNAILPAEWSHQNPIDIIGDATPERYRKVVELALQDENTDALIIILVPIAMSQPLQVAQEICAFASQSKKPIIACWMGEKQSLSSWQLFAEKHIPCYSTPEVAVEAFSYLANYYLSQQLLNKVPEPLISTANHTEDGEAKKIIAKALANQQTILTTPESKAVLKAFHIPISETLEVKTVEEAIAAAKSLGFPVVMKINSPDITHKQDVGGVELGILNEEEVKSAFSHMMARVKEGMPKAAVLGVTIERMYTGPNYRELMIGVIKDKVFGPVISFGAGGSLVEVIQDRAVALPPLNDFMARELIQKTRAMKMLGEFRGKPAVNMNSLVQVLVSVSELVCAFPEIVEMDINPLLVSDKEVIAVDCRIVIA